MKRPLRPSTGDEEFPDSDIFTVRSLSLDLGVATLRVTHTESLLTRERL